MSRCEPQVNIRMPDEIRSWLKETAKQNRRSMNAEIVFILEKEKALSAVTPKASDANTPNANLKESQDES